MRVEELPEPVPGPGEALLEVLVAGICGTDLQLAGGYMSFRGTPGHEFVGVVRAVSSPADRILVGSRVVAEINVGCNECDWCARGMGRHCAARTVLGILGRPGAFARKLTLPVSNLHVVPDAVSDDEAVFVEPLAAAFEILEQVRVEPSHRVLVMGDGRLGLLVAQVLKSRGAQVTLMGRHPSKLQVAKTLSLPTSESGQAARPVHDLVVDATGSPDALDEAIRWCRPRGTVILKTTCAGRTTFDAAPVVVNELILVGSRCGRFEPALEALRARSVQVLPLVTGERALADAPEAFEAAARPDALKILLRPAS